MKKMIRLIAVAAGIAFAASGAYAQSGHLSAHDQELAFQKIASLDSLNGYDVADIRAFVAKSSESDVKNYIVDLSYNKGKMIDNPNAQDLADLHASLEKKTLSQLIQD